MELEVLEKDCVYHIYNRGINGETIFANTENKKYFLKLLNKYLFKNTNIYSYCLLDNHFHLIVKINEDGKLVTQQFSNLFNAYAKAFNKMYSRTGSLFEKHFKRIRLHDEKYLQHLIIYIHLNPQKHFGMNFEKYEFSSYSTYLSANDTWIDKDYILELFGGRDNFVIMHKQRNDFLTSVDTFE